MKKLNEIMQELGFDKNGNQDVQKAFIKNLIRQAAQDDKVKSIQPEKIKSDKKEQNLSKGIKSATYMANYRKPAEQQLSFDPKNCGSLKTTKLNKTQAG